MLASLARRTRSRWPNSILGMPQQRSFSASRTGMPLWMKTRRNPRRFRFVTVRNRWQRATRVPFGGQARTRSGGSGVPQGPAGEIRQPGLGVDAGCGLQGLGGRFEAIDRVDGFRHHRDAARLPGRCW